MKTINRIHQNGAAKAAKSQAQTSGRKPENGSIVITDKAVDLIEEAESVLKELKQIGRAATAAVMMNAMEIESDGKEFSEGQLDLARHAGREFKNDFARLTGSAAISLSCLRADKDGTALPANPFEDEILVRPWGGIDQALTGLSHLLNLQDYAFIELGVSDVCGLSYTVGKRLEAANQAVEDLYSKLAEAVKAIYSRANRPERRAA